MKRPHGQIVEIGFKKTTVPTADETGTASPSRQVVEESASSSDAAATPPSQPQTQDSTASKNTSSSNPPQVAKPAASKTGSTHPSQVAKPAANKTGSTHPPQAAKPAVAVEKKASLLQQLGRLLRSLQILIWTAVALIVLVPLLGKFLIVQLPQLSDLGKTTQPLTVVVAPRPDWSQVDRSTAVAVQAARSRAEQFAAAELDEWQAELVPRVDRFLDWYFDFFNQKRLEFSAPFSWVYSAIAHSINAAHPPADEAVAEKLTAEFQKEFSKRVLAPRIAQMRFELIASNSVNLYLSDLSQNINAVQSQYHIPQGQWERYLDDISTTINDTEGNISNLSLKVLVGGSSYLIAKPLALLYMGKIGSKIGSKFAGTAVAKLAAKTGGAVAAEFGTTLLDPIVGAGILLWDFWDYHKTIATDRPLLRANLLDYLQDVRRSLLSDPESGILSAIDQVESDILKSLKQSSNSNSTPIPLESNSLPSDSASIPSESNMVFESPKIRRAFV